MKQHSFLRIAAALLIIISLSLATALPALALDLNPEDYFQFSINTVTFDKAEVAAGEVFHVTITGNAACTKDLPLPISEVIITSQVVAQPAAGGAALILNPQYIIDINPLPRAAGGTFNINQTVTLQFPAGAAPGSYIVVGHVTKADVKVLISIDVTGSFSQDQTLGIVKCIVPTTATAATTNVPTTAPTTAPTPTITPASSTIYSPGYNSPTLTDLLPITTIVIIGLIALVVVLLIIIIILLRRR